MLRPSSDLPAAGSAGRPLRSLPRHGNAWTCCGSAQLCQQLALPADQCLKLLDSHLQRRVLSPELLQLEPVHAAQYGLSGWRQGCGEGEAGRPALHAGVGWLEEDASFTCWCEVLELVYQLMARLLGGAVGMRSRKVWDQENQGA
eukprot:363585-Chlamydomonas_euryale.AAC.11